MLRAGSPSADYFIEEWDRRHRRPDKAQLFEQLKQRELALDAAKALQRHGWLADAKQYTAAIRALGRAKHWRDALDLLHAMDDSKRGIRANAIVYSAAARATVREGQQWLLGVCLMDEAHCLAVELDVIAYSTAVLSSELTRQWELATASFSAMKDTGLRVDLVLANSLLSGCERHGLYRQATRMMRAVQADALETDAFTYSSVVSACEKSLESNWVCALQMLRESCRGHIRWYSCEAPVLHTVGHDYPQHRDDSVPEDIDVAFGHQLAGCAPVPWRWRHHHLLQHRGAARRRNLAHGAGGAGVREACGVAS